jgi:ATP-binding cassette subfamily C (CFTR/MRP) protein 4
MFMTCSRWFGIVIDELSLAYTIAVTVALIANLDKQSGSSIGLTLSNVLLLTGAFQWGIRQSAEAQTQMTSVERVAELNKIDRELETDSKPPKGLHRILLSHVLYC